MKEYFPLTGVVFTFASKDTNEDPLSILSAHSILVSL